MGVAHQKQRANAAATAASHTSAMHPADLSPPPPPSQLPATAERLTGSPTAEATVPAGAAGQRVFRFVRTHEQLGAAAGSKVS